MSIRALPQPRHPALVQQAKQRRQNVQNRLADTITAFTGSMPFVFVHVLWFTLWIGVGAERYPFGLLTLIVSLEAIFLTSFVMISQNRADEKRQVLADSEWRKVQQEDQQNQQLLGIVNQILALTQAIDATTTAAASGHAPPGPAGPGPTAQDPGPA